MRHRILRDQPNADAAPKIESGPGTALTGASRWVIWTVVVFNVPIKATNVRPIVVSDTLSTKGAEAGTGPKRSKILGVATVGPSLKVAWAPATRPAIFDVPAREMLTTSKTFAGSVLVNNSEASITANRTEPLGVKLKMSDQISPVWSRVRVSFDCQPRPKNGVTKIFEALPVVAVLVPELNVQPAPIIWAYVHDVAAWEEVAKPPMIRPAAPVERTTRAKDFVIFFTKFTCNVL